MAPLEMSEASGDSQQPTNQLVEPGKDVILPFLDDTGSSIMVIHRNDLNMAEAKNRVRAPRLGQITVACLGITHTMETVRLYVTIRDDYYRPMIKSVPIQVAICDINPAAFRFRISGPWMRHHLYTATKPDRHLSLIVASRKQSLMFGINEVPHSPGRRPADLPIADNTYILTI